MLSHTFYFDEITVSDIEKKLKTHSQTLLRKEIPTNIYLLKVNNRYIRKRGEICSKLTMKTLERRH